ncbi:MAG: host attachment protein [Alphaproteobacteria bacterium]
MYKNIIPHQRPPITWIVVADSKQVQIYRRQSYIQHVPLCGGGNKYYQEKMGYELVLIPEAMPKAESLADYQLSSTDNAYGPQEDSREELKRRFLKAIALMLEQAHSRKSFDNLILVAPAKIIGGLREQLNPAMQTCVKAVLPKELTHFKGKELLEYLYDTLIEAHVA